MKKWILSAAWANKNVDCSYAAIKRGCGGCCWSKLSYGNVETAPKYISNCGNKVLKGEEIKCFVSEKNYENLKKTSGIKICEYIDPIKGCTLPLSDKPLGCSLFPLIITKNNKLVLWGRTLLPHSICNKNVNVGSGNILENNRADYERLFGEKQVTEAIESVKRGKDYTFELSDEFMDRWNYENELVQKGIFPFYNKDKK